MEVVGVVADTRDSRLDQLVTSDIYLLEKVFPQTHMVLIVETLAKPLVLPHPSQVSSEQSIRMQSSQMSSQWIS